MSTLVTVNLLGKDWPVTKPEGPSGFTSCEEWREMLRDSTEPQGFRIMGSAIGLTTKVARDSGITLEKCGYKMLAYGGEIYGWLRQQGATNEELLAGAPVCYRVLMPVRPPTEAEVADKVNFTSDGVRPT